MGYQLGVDLGTTFTAAAVARDGRAEMVSLGDRGSAVPSVLFLREDETLVTGDAANRRAMTEPGRVAREFKRRIGDTTPVFVGGTPFLPEMLMGKLLRWVYETVARQEGGSPESVAVCHPANWGAFKKDLLQQVVRMAGLEGANVITEPEAAAIYYASTERVDPGTTIAVYDLGGGTFDACILKKRETRGFEVLGRPEGIERLGGLDFDEAVFQHARNALGGALEQLDPVDPTAVAAVQRLRQDCVDAKEALSADTDVSIRVLLPNVQTEVRLTRSEFEDMVRPRLAESIDALHRALRSAGLETAQVDVVLLVGGSSRIPLVAQMIAAELGRPVKVDAHPKHSIALGAALAASPETMVAGPEDGLGAVFFGEAPSEPATPVGNAASAAGAAAVEAAAPVPPPPPPEEPTQPIARPPVPPPDVGLAPPVRKPKRSKAWIAIPIVLLLVAGGVFGAYLLMRPESKQRGKPGHSPKPSATHKPSPSGSPSPTKTGGGGGLLPDAITPEGQILKAGSHDVLALPSSASCSTFMEGVEGDCVQADMAGGKTYVLIATEPAGAFLAHTVQVVSYVPSAGGWVVWLEARDPGGGTWADVSAAPLDFTKDGKPELVVAFRYQGSGSELGYDLITYPAGGEPTVAAHPSEASHGSLTLDLHQVDEFRAEYPNGEADCCPPYFTHRQIRYVRGAFRAMQTDRVSRDDVPPSELV